MKRQKLLSIRVIRVPAGEAPEHFRRQWVGLVLWPAVAHDGTHAFGIETLREMAHRRCYVVPAVAAIERLMEKSPEAATWFARRYLPGMSFTFGADEVEVIENN